MESFLGIKQMLILILLSWLLLVAQFPGVQQFIQNTIATCRKQGEVGSCETQSLVDNHTGYVTTLMNRRRYFPSISSDNFMGRSHAERQAVNFVIQGK